MREVNQEVWVSAHRALHEQGYVRLEYLTATHLGEENFELCSKVSTADLTKTELLSTRVSGQADSISQIYSAAEFHERETMQMFGLAFTDLQNTSPAFDVDFEGHPLRKDFGLPKRVATSWPGAVEPDEKARRRPSLPPGVFETWSK